MAEDIKNQIVAESARLFYLYGFRKITVEEIASSLKMSKKTIYQYFSSKDEIILAVIDFIMYGKLAKLNDLADSNMPVMDALTKNVSVFREFTKNVSEPMMIDMKMMPEIWKKIEEKRLVLFQKIEDIVEKGKQEGSVRKDLNTDLFMRIFMSALAKFANPSMLIEMNMAPSDFLEQFTGIFFTGIINREKNQEVL